MRQIIDFFARLRQADEPIRRRWMYGLSATSMALVIFLWVGYLSIIIQNPDELAVRKDSERPGAARTFSAGLATISEGLGGFTDRVSNFFTNRLSQEHEIIIEVDETDRNFILESVEPSAPRAFP